MAAKAAAKGATPATRQLERAGIAHTLHAYPFAPGEDGIGLQAAAALGIEPARLLKTLVVDIDDEKLALALVAVDRELDLKAVAAALGGKRAAMAAVAAAERATGYVKGGISPIATRRRLAAVVDAAAMAWPRVVVNGGRRGFQIELDPARLVGEIGAKTAAISRR